MRIKDTKSATKSAMGCQGHQGCDQDYQGCHQGYQDKLKQKLCEAQPRKKGA